MNVFKCLQLVYLTVLLSMLNYPVLAQDNLAGFDHGFYIRSKDGSFVFRPFGLIHTDFHLIQRGAQINTDDSQASTFLTRRLRLGFEGQLYEKIDYDLETNVGIGGAELIFAWMNFGYIRSAQVRIGQFKEPFNYEVLLPEKYLDFIERSIVATVISPAEDIGVMIHNFGNPIGKVLEYGVGVFNGLGGSVKTTDKTFEYAGRIALYPFANSTGWLRSTRFAGYALFEGKRPEGIGIRPRTPLGFEFFPRIATKGTRFAMGGDFQWIQGPYSFSAEYIRNVEERSSNSTDAVIQGWDVDITYLITGEDKVRAMENGVEVAARIEKLKVDAGSPVTATGFTDASGNPVLLQKNSVTTLTLGLNYYLNYNIKFQINYQNDWFGNSSYTPSSRAGNILNSAGNSRKKLLVRVQLYF
jgi:hypothetical protein